MSPTQRKIISQYVYHVSSGPAVIKLFESENELKCKNSLRDFIVTLCLFSKIGENYLRHFKISLYRYNYLAKFLLLSRNSYCKILENILKFYDGGPRTIPIIIQLLVEFGIFCWLSKKKFFFSILTLENLIRNFRERILCHINILRYI